MTIWIVARTKVPGDVRAVFMSSEDALKHRGRVGHSIFKLMPDGHLEPGPRWLAGAGWRHY